MILITETWLNDNFSNNEILPKGYHVIRKDRTAYKRGGVLIALRENIVFNRLNASKNFPDWSAHLELIAIEVDLANSKKCLVCVCYRPPNCKFKEWFHLFSSFLQETSKYDNVLIAGDFNFPDLTWNSKLCTYYLRKKYIGWLCQNSENCVLTSSYTKVTCTLPDKTTS